MSVTAIRIQRVEVGGRGGSGSVPLRPFLSTVFVGISFTYVSRMTRRGHAAPAKMASATPAPHPRSAGTQPEADMRSARRSQSQLIAIGQNAPWVIASRLGALSRAASKPSAKDVGELHRMVDEKWIALGNAWWQMSAQWWQWQAGWWLRPQPWLGPAGDDPLRWWQEAMRAGDAVLASGLRPVARTVARNRRRLASRS